jgi:drug/metabolite transporter (DMT)-like permease
VSAFVIVIVLVSTFFHAGWNLLARYSGSESIFYRRMLVITMIVGFLPAVISEILTASMTQFAWLCVLGSGCCAAIYLYGLARAYATSDFTIVYPIARALPVIFIAIIDVLRGRYLTPLGWVGIGLVVTGSVFVPQQQFGDFRLKNYLDTAVIWMIIAALGTVGYTFLDKLAAEVVQSGPATAARYGYFYFTISFFPYMLLLRSNKPVQKRGVNHPWLLAGLGAIFGFSAYWLILWAYQLSPVASYIVAFRQFSIIIGAVLAFILFKEKGFAVRISGALCITSGLILIALWGT